MAANYDSLGFVARAEPFRETAMLQILGYITKDVSQAVPGPWAPDLPITPRTSSSSTKEGVTGVGDGDASRHPGRFMAFCMINMWYGDA